MQICNIILVDPPYPNLQYQNELFYLYFYISWFSLPHKSFLFPFYTGPSFSTDSISLTLQEVEACRRWHQRLKVGVIELEAKVVGGLDDNGKGVRAWIEKRKGRRGRNIEPFSYWKTVRFTKFISSIVDSSSLWQIQ